MVKSLTVTKFLGAVTSSGIILSFFIGLYVAFYPVDVLQDWKLTVEQKEFKIGETVYVKGKFKKIRSVNGESKRYFECKNQNGEYNIRVPAPEATADRPPGSSGVDLLLKVPSDIPIVPTTCRIAVNIKYRIYSFRIHTENNFSDEFRVVPSEVSQAPESVDEQNDNLVVESAPVSNDTRANIAPRTVPEPGIQAPNDFQVPTPEINPVMPPNNALVCRLPLVTNLLIQPILGRC